MLTAPSHADVRDSASEICAGESLFMGLAHVALTFGGGT